MTIGIPANGRIADETGALTPEFLHLFNDLADNVAAFDALAAQVSELAGEDDNGEIQSLGDLLSTLQARVTALEESEALLQEQVDAIPVLRVYVEQIDPSDYGSRATITHGLGTGNLLVTALLDGEHGYYPSIEILDLNSIELHWVLESNDVLTVVVATVDPAP